MAEPTIDSGADDYLAGRSLAQRGAAEQEWQALIGGAKAARPTASAAPPLKPAMAIGPAGEEVGLPAMPDYRDQLSPGARLVVAPSIAGGGIGQLGAVAKDVGKGVIDSPRQIIGGALDFVNNIANFVDKTGLPSPFYTQIFNNAGQFDPQLLSPETYQQLKAEGKTGVFHVPTTGDADTVTGHIVRAAIPFMLGRGMAGQAGVGGGIAGEAVKDFIGGAVASDPNQPRLSNVIDQVAPNFVTDFLKAKPEDENSLTGNLKTGLEFVGLGALATGAIRAVKAMKDAGVSEEEISSLGEGRTPAAAADNAGSAPGARLSFADQSAIAGQEHDILSLGDPLAPAVEVKPTASDAAMAEVTADRMAATEGVSPGLASGAGEVEPNILSEQTISDYLAGRRVDNPIKINLARIGSNEDIADALAQVSKTIPARAVQSNDATIALSDALGLTPENFIAGYKGQNLDAAQTTALRFMLDSSASQLIDYAKVARDPLASPEAKAQFVKAFTVHRAIQDYAENARSEAGRTLQSWSIMSQQRANYTKAIGDLIQNAGSDIGQMADRVAELGNPLQLGRFVAGSMQGNGRDLLLSVWYNALLSSPTTIVKKLASDVGMATWNVAATAVAERFGSGAVGPGETFNLLAGYAGSMKDAIRAGGKALAAGESQFYRDYQSLDWARAPGGSPAEVADRVNRNFRISALMNGAPEEINPAEPTKAAWEYLRALKPTSWIAGADDFAKVWNYRAEMRRLAWRQSNGDADDFARLLDDTPYQMSQQAIGSALKNTFQEPLTGIGAHIKDIANSINIPLPGTNFEIPIGRMIMPFVKVPYNIAKTAADNSPLAVLMQRNREIMAGPASPERDLMMARMGMGTGVALGMADLALNGYITGKGPSDPNLRREWIAAGNQPYSIQIPGLRPASYNWFEPFGLTASAVADTFNIMKFREDEADFGTLIPSLVFGIGNAMLSKTYYEGVAKFFDALQHPEHEGDHWLQSLGTSMIPNLAGKIGDMHDEWRRAHYGFIDSLEAKMPWLREGLPPQVTLWGDPVPAREAFAPLLSGRGIAQIFSPATLGPDPAKTQPIDRWIWDNRDAFGLGRQGEPRGISRLSRTQTFRPDGNSLVGVQMELSPQQFYRLQVLAGNEIKDPTTGMGAKDTLNSLVMGHYPIAAEQRQWDRAGPEEKALHVQSIVGKYRKAARDTLLREDGDLLTAVQSAWQAKAQTLAPTPPTIH